MLEVLYPQYEDLDLDREQGDRELLEFPSLFVNPKGETLTLCSKDVHMKSICSCEGRIILEDCRIIYNEESDGNAFSLESGAEFSAENCVFIDAGYSTVPFIKTHGDNINLSFSDCLFIDCAHFIEADDSANVLISGCELENCNHDFAVCKNSHFELNESKIIFTDKYEKKTHTMIDATDVLIYTENCTGNIKAVQYVGKKETDICVFAKGLTVEDCCFQDLPCPIEGCEEIKNSIFINCSGAIGNTLNRHSTLFSPDRTSLVDNCDFVHCTNTIHNAKIVNNCRFESNFGTVITSQYTEGFAVSKCFFKGIDGTDADKPVICYAVGEEMQVTVEKCVFEDCCFGANWCIGPKADDVFIDRPKDPSVDIYLCYFKNCSAVDVIQGALVYPGPLYKQRVFRDNKPIYGVIHITDCKGLSNDNPWSRSEAIAALHEVIK